MREQMNQQTGEYPEKQDSVIYVRMFGGLSISAGGHTLSEDINRSRKSWNLLSYLIMTRSKDISINELFQALWQDDSQENPYGSLKTLVCRVRKRLEEAGFPAQEMILGQKGAYTWNPALEILLDAEQFEELCQEFLTPEDGDQAWEEAGREAFELYRGEFLPKLSEESWVRPLNAYYHSLYRRLVCRLAECELKRENFGSILEITERAAEIDPFSEDFHYYRIYALYRDGQSQTAIEEYRAVTERFYKERMMTPSERFKDLYEVISSGGQEIAADLSQVAEKLIRPSQGQLADLGAYQCEYSVFKRLFQLERRKVERSGNSVYLCLLTVGDRRGCPLKPEIQARAMERLRAAVRKTLRSSDVYSRYSVSQYILMLSATTYENGERVMNRILTAFNKAYVRKEVAITASLNAVMPRES